MKIFLLNVMNDFDGGSTWGRPSWTRGQTKRGKKQRGLFRCRLTGYPSSLLHCYDLSFKFLQVFVQAHHPSKSNEWGKPGQHHGGRGCTFPPIYVCQIFFVSLITILKLNRNTFFGSEPRVNVMTSVIRTILRNLNSAILYCSFYYKAFFSMGYNQGTAIPDQASDCHTITQYAYYAYCVIVYIYLGFPIWFSTSYLDKPLNPLPLRRWEDVWNFHFGTRYVVF